MISRAMVLLLAFCALACQDDAFFPGDEFGGPSPSRVVTSTRALEDFPNTVGSYWEYDAVTSAGGGKVRLTVLSNQSNTGGYRDRAVIAIDRAGVRTLSTIDYVADTVFLPYWNLRIVFPLAIGSVWGYYHDGYYDRARVEDTVSVAIGGRRFDGVYVINYNLLSIVKTVWVVPRLGVLRITDPFFSITGYQIVSPLRN